VVDVTGTPDLLHLLADEHRDLTAATRRLRQGRRGQGRDAVRRTALRVVEHELAHRLLVHPLLRRDRWGRHLFADRREEQLLLADRLRRLLLQAPEGEVLIDLVAEPPRVARGLRARPFPTSGADPAAGLDLQLVEHTDREEILEFPHVRHLASRDELTLLGPRRHELREVVLAQLRAEPRVLDGRWATTARRDLPDLLGLPDEVVLGIPDLAPGRRPTVTH
jgi:hypothetical protein